MIKEHEFNSAWIGKPVGLVTDTALLECSAQERATALSPFAWVELRTGLDSRPAPKAMHDAGFFYTDTLVQFRIGLNRVESRPSLDDIEVRFADERPFTVEAEQLQSWVYERFTALPGLTQEDVDRRYALLANQIIAAQPAHCLEVLLNGEPQGWYCAEPSDKGLYLTAASHYQGAKVSGLLLYQKALRAFAERGARIGFAGFSITNQAVHNIYAQLGARFTGAIECWFWVRS